MIKKIITIIAILFIIGLAFVVFFSKKEEPKVVNSFEECVSLGFPVLESYPEQCIANGEIFVRNIGNELEKTDLVVLNIPRPGDEVSFPLELSGRARGPWFFEASFMAEVLDGDGTPIGMGIMTANGEWMTTEFVPFSGTIELTVTPKFKEGTLLLHKDNPSGEPQFDDKLIVPVFFSQ
jgi:hypothetical protein